MAAKSLLCVVGRVSLQPLNRPAPVWSRVCAVLLGIAALCIAPATAVRAMPRFTVIASGFNLPVFAISPPGDNRTFVLQRDGHILVSNGSGQPFDAFMTVPNAAGTSNRGVLGLAFDPAFATNHRFYTYGLRKTGMAPDAPYAMELKRFTLDAANPARGDPASGQLLLSIPHNPDTVHNGGTVMFGRDGYLYITSGDGDPAEPTGLDSAQDLQDLRGKILRIDVHGDDFPADPARNYAIPSDNPFVGMPTAAPEIFAYGLRNPFRASIDDQTGDLYIGDVGWMAREEIDVIPAGSGGGQNFGWGVREGFVQTVGNTDPTPADAIDPLLDYAHGTLPDVVARAVTGGVVYHGAISALDGRYIFGDFITGELWSVRPDGSELTDLGALLSGIGPVNITAITLDGMGALQIVDYFAGRLLRLSDDSPPTTVNEPAGTLLILVAVLGLACRRRRLA